MTEEEWLAAEHPDPLLTVLDGTASERKSRLFACACCRRIKHFLRLPEFARTIEVTEWFVDGQVTQEEFRQAFKVIDDHIHAQTPEHGVSCVTEFPLLWASAIWYERDSYPIEAARHCSEGARDAVQWYDPDHHARLAAGPPNPELRYPFTSEELAELVKASEVRGAFERTERQRVQAQEAVQQLALLRDIFGNPFRPVAADPNWLTSTVVALAEGIYAERAFDRMPILADALQDAGCTNEDMLNHCRDANQVHVRGCWVVDLLLGKA